MKEVLEDAMKAEVVDYSKTRRYQVEYLGKVKGIYLAGSYRVAVKWFKVWCRRWCDKVPKAVRCLERDIENLLVFYEQNNCQCVLALNYHLSEEELLEE